jgi:glyoxylase-like metal-dependent hydrolase (beta-lactamase superfamily II)
MAHVTHLNCATMCPYGARVLSGEGGVLEKAMMCAHVLVVESSDGLVLVDTGLGSGDIAEPRQTGAVFRHLICPRFLGEETAVSQLRARGIDPSEVRHVLITHLDVDHAGGLPDFPHAEVHLFRDEMEAALDPSLRERVRYIPAHFRHGPEWRPYVVDGDEWFGFESVRAIEGVDPEMAIVPLVGHSRGHSAIAIRDGDGWLMHCGDAYFHHDEIEAPPGPVGLRAFEGITAWDNEARRHNQQRLRELRAREPDRITMFCSHDPVELERLGGPEQTDRGGTPPA